MAYRCSERGKVSHLQLVQQFLIYPLYVNTREDCSDHAVMTKLQPSLRRSCRLCRGCITLDHKDISPY